MIFDVGVFPTASAGRIGELAQLTESLGYEGFWIGDSHLIWREAYVTLGHVAGITRRIRLGTGVTNCVTRHATVLASAWATLHELSGGRAVVGIGAGDSSLATMGKGNAKLADLRSTIALMRDLWAGRTPDGDGAPLRLWGRPGAIPVYIAGSGPRILELAGEVADGAIFLSGVAPEFVGAAMERVATGSRRVGRAPDEVDTTLWTVCCIRPNAEEAFDGVRAFAASILRHPLPYELPAEDQAVAERIRREYDFYQHMDVGAKHRDLVPAATLRRLTLVGTAEDVLQQVRQLSRTGLRRVVVVVLGPAWEETIEAFARHVIPAIRQEEAANA